MGVGGLGHSASDLRGKDLQLRLKMPLHYRYCLVCEPPIPPSGYCHYLLRTGLTEAAR